MDNRIPASAQFLVDELGFSPETTGGGCIALSRYWESGWHCMVTDDGGLDMPSGNDFIVCVYPPEWDGSPIEFDMRSDVSTLSFRQAVAAAVAACEGLPDTMESLTAIYTEWLASRSYRHLSADELLHDLPDDAPPSDRRWLSHFVRRWEAMAGREQSKQTES